MSALKKKYIFHNISRFLEENLLVLFFNYNHINTEEWHLIKQQFSKIKQVNTLVVKNRIANNVIKKKEKGEKKTESIEKLSTLFQGPCFLIGMLSPEKCEKVLSVIKKQKKCIFVGALYRGQLMNHLDVSYLLKVEKVAYANLVSTLQHSLSLTPITTNYVQLYYLLKCYGESKKN